MSESIYNKFFALPIMERIGLLGLYSFLFFAWESKARAAVSFLFVLVPCLVDRRFWNDLRTSRVAWVVALLMFYILVRGGVAVIENPQHLQYHLQDGWRLILLGGFVFIAWLLRGDQRRVFLALAIALLGFWVGRLEHFPWNEAFSGWQWWSTREKFGLPSEIGFGLYSAAATIGLLVLAGRIWSIDDQTRGKLFAVLAWGVFLLLSVQGIVMSQTRSVWLSLIVLACVMLVGNMHIWKRIGFLKSTALIVCVAGLLMLIAYANQSTIKNRFSTELDTITQLLSGNFEDIQAANEKGHDKSIGVRYHMILFALDHWKKAPWFGLGPGSSEPLIEKHWVASKKHRHLHNAYLEILLRLGIAGTALILLMLALILYGGWRAYREQRLDRDLFILLVAAITLPLLVGFTSFRMLHADWRYYWFLMGGALYSFSLFHPSSSAQNDTRLTSNKENVEPTAG